MDMKVMVLKDSALFRVEGFDQSQRDLNGLFHDVPQLPGDQEFPFALGQFALDIQDLAASTGPGKAGHYAGSPGSELPVMMHGFVTQVFRQVRFRHRKGVGFLSDKFYGCAPAQRVDQFFQIPDSGFHGVFIDHFPQGAVGEPEFLRIDPHGCFCFRQEMLLCDMIFLKGSIARERDHFHTVQERLGDSVR